MYKIGEVSNKTGLSIDTLRYYEKYGLLDNIARNTSGMRIYSDQDISSLNFIKRAQKMNFRLSEIKDLLRMRQDPQNAKDSIRQLTVEKLKVIEAQLSEIQTLRNELLLLINLCRGSQKGCPIMDAMDAGKQT